jgi:hypothetical protein
MKLAKNSKIKMITGKWTICGNGIKKQAQNSKPNMNTGVQAIDST